MSDDIIEMLIETINKSGFNYISYKQVPYIVVVYKSDSRYIGRIVISGDKINVIWNDRSISLVEYTDNKFLKLLNECANDKRRRVFFTHDYPGSELVGNRYW